MGNYRGRLILNGQTLNINGDIGKIEVEWCKMRLTSIFGIMPNVEKNKKTESFTTIDRKTWKRLLAVLQYKCKRRWLIYDKERNVPKKNKRFLW